VALPTIAADLNARAAGLESKIDMKRRGMPSPDGADAMALCFSEPGGAAIVRSRALNFGRVMIYLKHAGY